MYDLSKFANIFNNIFSRFKIFQLYITYGDHFCKTCHLVCKNMFHYQEKGPIKIRINDIGLWNVIFVTKKCAKDKKKLKIRYLPYRTFFIWDWKVSHWKYQNWIENFNPSFFMLCKIIAIFVKKWHYFAILWKAWLRAFQQCISVNL